ncbi:hypothetical protein I2I11_07075 [Pontibacter sp. 172403-2]|uniref:hypothetical protein n=1 Tax=Pontibacter rufus TaxID=2791028 RepID=UPI0018AFB057|nr:hypothetical protein [Pontibacter sp. 172403-2]MBF9253048.1 hypothetical protein [Pontibacter sp. 172403-2]
MISYFRSILPSRLILLILLFLGLQASLLLAGTPATAPELLHMLVGERMANGFALYRQIYDDTAPLSALVYWLTDLLAGRSFLTYRVVALALLLLQALLFNITLNRHSVYAGKNFLPALLYLTLGSLSFEFSMLTPLLIGNTFLILSLPYIITVSREGLDNNRLFIGGFMLGLAALSYLPLALFLMVGTFAVIFFASSTFRSFLLMLCGFAFPYAVLGTYYLYTNSLTEFLTLHLLQPWRLEVGFILAPADLVKLMALPALVLLISLMSTLSLPQRLVFQVKFQQVMWVWLVISLVVIFTRHDISAGTFVLLLPPIAYFSEFFFTSRRKTWLLNLIFLLVLAGVLVLRYRQLPGLNWLIKVDESPLVLPAPPETGIKNTTVLVLGNDISYYTYNRPVTPYLNWQLAQRHFAHLSEYQAVFDIYQNFQLEQPAYIVDKVNLMPHLQYKLPAVFGKYKPTGSDGIYQRVR